MTCLCTGRKQKVFQLDRDPASLKMYAVDGVATICTKCERIMDIEEGDTLSFHPSQDTELQLHQIGLFNEGYLPLEWFTDNKHMEDRK